ncbi:hypothetical protein CTEN210_13581 [Chaetoceros tenuissimus]|uniref:KAP NTPase domain-containing protein n=1 Tax=Chaetoceros tenuissimus TaxID=426638 RepID=A0AAD3D5G0_9STRA|nr:hypothetical protein CTEN210_13581 [Chaetoceros tenuissimus]
MRLQRKLTNREWEKVKALGPGVHNFRGKKTLIYNGEELMEGARGRLVYNEDERDSWEVLIVLPGVEVISERTFFHCKNVKVVIMADTVKRIEKVAFSGCWSLIYIKLSRNLEFIGKAAFNVCPSLTSIVIPPSCREIGERAFWGCHKLIILSIPRHTQLGHSVIGNTALSRIAQFKEDERGEYDSHDEINQWIKNRHDDFPLHKICCSEDPTLNQAEYDAEDWTIEDDVNLTPLHYLSSNSSVNITTTQTIIEAHKSKFSEPNLGESILFDIARYASEKALILLLSIEPNLYEVKSKKYGGSLFEIDPDIKKIIENQNEKDVNQPLAGSDNDSKKSDQALHSSDGDSTHGNQRSDDSDDSDDDPKNSDQRLNGSDDNPTNEENENDNPGSLFEIDPMIKEIIEKQNENDVSGSNDDPNQPLDGLEDESPLDSTNGDSTNSDQPSDDSNDKPTNSDQPLDGLEDESPLDSTNGDSTNSDQPSDDSNDKPTNSDQPLDGLEDESPLDSTNGDSTNSDQPSDDSNDKPTNSDQPLDGLEDESPLDSTNGDSTNSDQPSDDSNDKPTNSDQPLDAFDDGSTNEKNENDNPKIRIHRQVSAINDNPKLSPDRLGYNVFAESIVKVVQEAEKSGSYFCTGLFGPWGCGKSKLWTLIKEYLEKKTIGVDNSEKEKENDSSKKKKREKYEGNYKSWYDHGILRFTFYFWFDFIKRSCRIQFMKGSLEVENSENSYIDYVDAMRTEIIASLLMVTSPIVFPLIILPLLYLQFNVKYFMYCGNLPQDYEGEERNWIKGFSPIFLLNLIISKAEESSIDQVSSVWDSIGGKTAMYSSFSKHRAFTFMAFLRRVLLVPIRFCFQVSRFAIFKLIPLWKPLICHRGNIAPEKSAVTKYIFVEFNAWTYNGSDNLWASFMDQLWTSVESDFSLFQVRMHRASINLIEDEYDVDDNDWEEKERRRSAALFQFYMRSTISLFLALFGVCIGIWVLVQNPSRKAFFGGLLAIVLSLSLFQFYMRSTFSCIVTLAGVSIGTWVLVQNPSGKSIYGGLLSILLSPLPFGKQLYIFLKDILPVLKEGPNKLMQISMIGEDFDRRDFTKDMGYMGVIKKEAEYLFDFLRVNKYYSEASGKLHPVRMSIFVDDLDRCNSKTVVLVLEALFLLLNESPITCFLAIDSRLVVASIDEHYTVHDRAEVTGYDFLEKIVQLPFCIPDLSQTKKKEFMNRLFLNGQLDAIKLCEACKKINNFISRGTFPTVDKLNINDDYGDSSEMALSSLIHAFKDKPEMQGLFHLTEENDILLEDKSDKECFLYTVASILQQIQESPSAISANITTLEENASSPTTENVAQGSEEASVRNEEVASSDSNQVRDVESGETEQASVRNEEVASSDSNQVRDVESGETEQASVRNEEVASSNSNQVRDVDSGETEQASVRNEEVALSDSNQVRDVESGETGISSVRNEEVASSDVNQVRDVESGETGISSVRNEEVASSNSNQVRDVDSGETEQASVRNEEVALSDSNQVRDVESGETGISSVRNEEVASSDSNQVRDVESGETEQASVRNEEVALSDSNQVLQKIQESPILPENQEGNSTIVRGSEVERQPLNEVGDDESRSRQGNIGNNGLEIVDTQEVSREANIGSTIARGSENERSSVNEVGEDESRSRQGNIGNNELEIVDTQGVNQEENIDNLPSRDEENGPFNTTPVTDEEVVETKQELEEPEASAPFTSMVTPQEREWFGEFAPYIVGKARSINRAINVYILARQVAEKVVLNSDEHFRRKLMKLIILAEFWPYRTAFLMQVAEDIMQLKMLEDITNYLQGKDEIHINLQGLSLNQIIPEVTEDSREQEKTSLSTLYNCVVERLLYASSKKENGMKMLSRDNDPQLFECLLSNSKADLKDLLRLEDLIVKSDMDSTTSCLRLLTLNMSRHMLEFSSRCLDNLIFFVESSKDARGNKVKTLKYKFKDEYYRSCSDETCLQENLQQVGQINTGSRNDEESIKAVNQNVASSETVNAEVHDESTEERDIPQDNPIKTLKQNGIFLRVKHDNEGPIVKAIKTDLDDESTLEQVLNGSGVAVSKSVHINDDIFLWEEIKQFQVYDLPTLCGSDSKAFTFTFVQDNNVSVN